ncbi:MAG TPA: DHA2 family efflux MFS transporter permease subunit [Solirubrobacteraceae bacterium]|nr:DHA2 family efflux MFS transporter permease subunit [Solirubrobacteraceae bacterium]
MERAAAVRKGPLLALLAASQFVVVLDASITNVALPSIGRDLALSQDSLSWVVNSYTLTFGGFLLLGGRLADILGRRRVYIWGLVLFAIASFVGGFSQSETTLIIARAVQGLGAALLSPAALSILTSTFREGAERNRALGVWGGVAGAGGAAGVLLGGLLTEYLSWRWVLFVNVPIAVGAVLLAPRLVPESRDERERAGFDLAGAFTVTAGLAVLIYALVDANDAGWGSTQTIVLLALAAALLVSFVVVESRAAAPLVPFDVFRSRTRTGAYATGLLVGASLFSMFFFVSLYMQQVLGWDALKSGLAYLPLAITIILAAGIASVLVTKIGFKPVVITGLLSVAAGLFLFSRISADGSFGGDILIPSLLAAVGLGFSFVPVTIGGTTGIAPDEAGLASGLINAGQQVGGALGLAILAAVATARTEAASTGPGPPGPEALTEGFQAAFLGGAAFALIGAVIAAVLIRSQDSRAVIGQGPEPVT